MLVLGRHVGEKIVVDGPCTILITGISIYRGKGYVRVGIEADQSVKIMRSELLDESPSNKPGCLATDNKDM